MAEQVVVDGPALIRCGTGSEGALETVGYSENGVQIFETLFSLNVPGDQNGGVDGPPIDIQYFGLTHRIRCECSKWDPTIADKITGRALGTTAGAIGTPGSLYAAGSFGFRLLISPTNRPRNYLFAIPREPVEVNKGTRYSRLVLDFEAHAVSGVLYNATTA